MLEGRLEGVGARREDWVRSVVVVVVVVVCGGAALG